MHGKYDHKIANNVYTDCLQLCDLKEYEELCPRCKGWGDVVKMYADSTSSTQCRICRGKGKIDWIDKIKNGIKR